MGTRRRSLLAVSGLCGMLSVILFTAMDVVGVTLRPDYSAISQAVSELIEVGAANKSLLDALLVGYHGLVIPFALGLHLAINNGTGSRLAPALLAGAGSLGVILTLFFPCDPGCEPFVTLRGTMHIAIAIPMGFAILFAILAFSNRLARDEGWAGFTVYTRISFAAGIALAALTVALAETEVVGVLERVLTASYLQWYALMGFVLMRPGWSRVSTTP